MVSLRDEREQAAARARRARWQLAIVAGIVLAAVAGLLVLAGGRPLPGRSAYEAGTTDPVAAAVPVLAGYAEQARGLRFRRPPVVRVADPAAIARAVAQSAAEPAGRAATERALAFSSRRPVTSPAAAYDPRQRVVYVRQGQPPDAHARVALVHALTRALQDQSYDLSALTRPAAADPD